MSRCQKNERRAHPTTPPASGINPGTAGETPSVNDGSVNIAGTRPGYPPVNSQDYADGKATY